MKIAGYIWLYILQYVWYLITYHNNTGDSILNESATTIMHKNGILRLVHYDIELLSHMELKSCPVKSTLVFMGHIPSKDGEISI